MKVKELIIEWGFDLDEDKLQALNGHIKSTANIAMATAAAVAAIGASAGFVLQQAGKMEQWTISFETMLGSAEKAQALLKDIKDFAKTTPFELPGVVTASKQLLAVGVSQEKIIPNLKSLGDVAAGLNVPLDRLILNFGQIKTQGKLTGRELRDFAVAGVPLLAELSKNLNKSEVEIQEMISRGEIGFPIVEQAFRSMTSAGGRFADLMDKQSKSLFGIISNIKDVLIQFAIDVGYTLLDDAKSTLKDFLNFLEENRDRIKKQAEKLIKDLLKFIRRLRDGLNVLVVGIRGVTKMVGGLDNALRILMWTLGSLLAMNILSFIGKVGQMVFALIPGLKLLGNTALISQAKAFAIPLAIGAVLVSLGLMIEDIIGYFTGKKSLTGQMFDWLDNKVPSSIRMLIEGFLPLIAMLRGIKKLMDLISSGKMSAWLKNIKSGFISLLEPVTKIFESVSKIFSFNFGKKGKDAGMDLTKPSGIVDSISGGLSALTPSFAGLVFPGAPKTQTVNNNPKINAPINVKVEGGVTNEATGNIVADKVSQALDGFLGRTLRNTYDSIEDRGE